VKEKVLEFLNSIGKMPPALNDHLSGILTWRRIPKGTLIFAKGSVCNEIFFLLSGMVVGVKWQKGQEVTTWIMREGDVITSPESFFEQLSSEEWIIAVEDCEVLSITYRELENTYAQFPIFNLHGRILTQRYYMRNLKLTDFMKRYTATEKYKILLEMDPELLLRCPNKYLASYLNVNVTTLSTIRSEIMEGR
jgi:CRP/FNR family transcriptional regulator, anaerobic regulatory protein